MDKNELNPQESFAIIQEVIEAEKVRFSENGFIYRFWGWLVVIAAIGQFVLLKLEMYSLHFTPWFLMILGAIFTGIYYGRKKERASLPVSGKTLAFTWIFVCINVFGVAFFLPELAGKWLLFIILSQISIGTVVAGSVLKFNILIWGGLVCNACAFVSLFVPNTYWTLLAVVAVVFSNLIPGYALKAMHKK